MGDSTGDSNGVWEEDRDLALNWLKSLTVEGSLSVFSLVLTVALSFLWNIILSLKLSLGESLIHQGR